MTESPSDPPPAPSRKLRAVFWLYQLVAHIIFPAFAALVVWRSRKEPLYRAHFPQRLGFGRTGPRGSVWVFSASLGEIRAVSPLVRQLLEAGHSICLTYSSPAGLAEGRRLFPSEASAVTHRYVPVDLIWCVFLFLVRLRPQLGLVVESELWPGQLFAARWLRIPMVQVNGNLIDRSIDRDMRYLGGVRLELLRLFHRVLTKTDVYKARYLRGGVDPARIAVVGELKFDQFAQPEHLKRAHDLHASWSAGRPVFMIASSVAAETDDLIDLVSALRQSEPRPRVVWAPRSPQEFDRIAARFGKLGWSFERRSHCLNANLDGDISPEADIFLGDSIGEMNFYYGLADLVFVGASLVPRGGHNIVEPLALRLPVVIGPSIFGITYPAEDARDAGALIVASGIDELKTHILRLLTDPAALEAQRARVRDFSAKHLGASTRSFKHLAPLLRRMGAGPWPPHRPSDSR